MQSLSAESKARIVDKLPVMMFQCLYDPPNFPFVYASEGCEALTGYTPDVLVSGGMKFMDLVHPDDVQTLNNRHDATLSIGAPLEATFRITTKDGSEKRILSHSRVADTNDKGMPQIIDGFFTDITKQITMETASETNRANSDFWSKMGFDVRTPMNAILGLAELGLRENLPDPMREYTQKIKRAGHKLMSVMNNIMDFKRIESGELEIRTEEYMVASLVNDTVNFVKDEIGDLDFHVFVDSKLPSVLVGDAARLYQVLQGLLSNAIKFTDKGSVSLSVQGEIIGDAVNLTITVSDTGRGIKEEDFVNLFKEFAQFDSKTIEGSGLGLAVTKKLVKLMGGEIHVASGFGVGCVFTVTMPQGVQDTVQAICEVSDSDNKKVLILAPIQHIFDGSLVRTFRNLDVECTAVSTTPEFLDIIAGGHYSHVFIDESYGDFWKDGFRELHPDVFASVKTVLISNKKGAIENGLINLTKPLYCLPVASILNGVWHSRFYCEGGLAWFSAPDARVLVVDDVDANLTVAIGFLRPYNMRVDLCSSGAEAIEAVKMNRYDMILMDHLMPVMTGSETTAHIRGIGADSRTDCKNVPIIAMSANTDYASRELFKKSGLNDFLPKPIDEVRLNAIVEKWIPKDKQHAIKPQKSAKPIVHHTPFFTIEGVDVQKGIAKTGGNPEAYLRVIKNFFEDGRRLSAELRNCVETGDMNNYNVHVHAIAGVCEGIGADEVSLSAKKLEEASKMQDIHYVRANNDAFLAKLAKLLENIYPQTVKAKVDHTPVIEPGVDRKRILIIDDTDSYLLMLDEILMSEFDTMSSLEGEGGLETAKETVPDLILLDLVMPGMSGYEALEKLKADDGTKHIPVILMSANEQEDAEKGSALGAAGFIKKPFDPDSVKNIVQSNL